MGIRAPLCQWHTKRRLARTFCWMWTWKNTGGGSAIAILLPYKAWHTDLVFLQIQQGAQPRDGEKLSPDDIIWDLSQVIPIVEFRMLRHKILHIHETKIWTRCLRRVRGKQCIIREKENHWLRGKNWKYFSGFQGILWYSANLAPSSPTLHLSLLILNFTYSAYQIPFSEYSLLFHSSMPLPILFPIWNCPFLSFCSEKLSNHPWRPT